jgi:hypothetical protein
MVEIFKNLPDQVDDIGPAESDVPTRYAVRCWCNHMDLVYMTEKFYAAQMERPSKTWICPRCFNAQWECSWDDDNYEREDLTADFGDGTLEDEKLFPIED